MLGRAERYDGSGHEGVPGRAGRHGELIARNQVRKTGRTTAKATGGRRVRAGVVVAGAVLFVLALSSTVGSSPFVCSACHRDQADGMAATAHADVDCYACHLANGGWSFAAAKTDELFRMYPAALVGRGLSRPAATTGRGACLGCHAEVLDGTLTGSWLRIDHANCAPGPTCDVCHGTTAHGSAVRWQPTYVMEDCVACHSEKGASITCETCHPEGAKRPTDAPKGPWQVTHGPNWEKTHGLGSVDTCVTCHPNDYCTRCHGVAVPHPRDFGGTHGKLATEKPEVCERCHPARAEFCDACHTIEMPHPATFLKQHSSIAEGRADARCFRCHADGDCDACHEAHIHPGGAKGVPVPWSYTDEELRP